MMNKQPYDDTTRYRTDDLQTKGFTIVQDKHGFCFGTDAVLLADFAATYLRSSKKIMDLCSGNGIVPLLMCARKDYQDITAVDFDYHCYQLIEHNAERNHLTKIIHPLCCDVAHIPSNYNGRFDAITVNPPYFNLGCGILSKEQTKQARHETDLPLSVLIRTASRLLKEKGSLYMIYKPHRTTELIKVLQENRMELKVLRFVHAKVDRPANLLLLRAVKDGGVWSDIMPPLILHNEDGTPSMELEMIYRRDQS